MSRDMNNVIEISNAEKENDLTNTLTEKISTSLKYKMLNLSVSKSAKCVQISKRSIISTSEKMIKEILISNLKILKQSVNLNKYNLNIIQTVQKKLNKIAEFINVIAVTENTVTNNCFFKLLSETHFSDLVNKKLRVNVVF
ncbi:hypothetical protein EMPG_13467 [Blastomyces silverae]|uniref:Uncharacterized protein n=1 Tax=Blastomyces silverae TaxID=2060906 RepID=A0A0H1BJE9_9EURO|nr:hypothetical protein EMPG_13467 [Blastomyces silverae]